MEVGMEADCKLGIRIMPFGGEKSATKLYCGDGISWTLCKHDSHQLAHLK